MQFSVCNLKLISRCSVSYGETKSSQSSCITTLDEYKYLNLYANGLFADSGDGIPPQYDIKDFTLLSWRCDSFIIFIANI